MPLTLSPLPPFNPAASSRAWSSAPHPTLPLLATASSDKSVKVYSLQDFGLHSTLEGGHKRSVRSVAWKPNLRRDADGRQELGIVTGSFDASAGVWRRFEGGSSAGNGSGQVDDMEVDMGGDDGEEDKQDWEFSLVLEGHDSEIKSVAFSTSGQFLATCSRDKSVWIWEELGAEYGDDEWETVAVLQEHEGDVKMVKWHPEEELLASCAYDDSIRLWRDEGDDWGCVAVINGHADTVWAIDWEAPAASMVDANGDREEQDVDAQLVGPRLASCSADATIRIWRRVPPAEPSSGPASNGIPSTMRPPPVGETWVCEATLPQAHDRAIYSIAWSKSSGRIVSTGSDSRIVIYEERAKTTPDVTEVAEVPVEAAVAAVAETAAQAPSTCGHDHDHDGHDHNHAPAPSKPTPTPHSPTPANTEWVVIASHEGGHGPYEINHVAWCGRFDGGRRGTEEMVVTTGDDGVVRGWTLEG